MPGREIKAKYTKSEIAIMAWRSAETSFNMRSRAQGVSQVPPGPQNPVQGLPDPSMDVLPGLSTVQNAAQSHYERASTAELQKIEERLGPVVYKMVDDKTGDIDMRKLTGAEAMRYLGALGINVMGRS